jgi:hypothetical protein
MNFSKPKKERHNMKLKLLAACAIALLSGCAAIKPGPAMTQRYPGALAFYCENTGVPFPPPWQVDQVPPRDDNRWLSFLPPR